MIHRRSALWLIPLLLALVTGPTRAAETVVHFVETATIMVSPDELAVTLRAEMTAPSAAEAQSRVNAMARDVTAAITQARDIQFSTGGYQVWRVAPSAQDRVERWQAMQNFRLSSTDGAALLALVGTLQQGGVIVSSMQWRLSRASEKKAGHEATREAVAALTGRATETASLLGMRFDHFRAVKVDDAEPIAVRPQPAMLTARAADAAPPVAMADDIAVTATARAEALMSRR